MRPPRFTSALALFAMGALTASPLPPSEQKPADKPVAPGIQRERVSLVLIDVVVTDRKGHRVDDLRREEFSLKVDGSFRPIESVELQVVGGSTEGSSSAPKSVREGSTPAVPITPSPAPRQFVLLLDGLNGERGLGAAAIESARKFLAAGLPPEDQVMIAGLGRELKVYQEFTGDREKLLRALAALESDRSLRMAGENHVRANIEYLETLHALCGDCYQGPAANFAQEDRNRITRTLAALRALVAHLHAREGRKEVLYLTDGFAANPGEAYYALGRESGLEPECLKLAREAASAQVVLNTVNTQGMPGDRLGVALERMSTHGLATFALNSGGLAFHGSNTFESALARVERETRASYVLSYAPPGAPDGRFHSTQVFVDRKGVRVRAREGYIWMTEEQLREREILSAYVTPELFKAIPLALEARSYLAKGTRPSLEVAIAVLKEMLLFLPKEGTSIAYLEAGVIFRSGKSEVVDRFSRGVEVRLSADEAISTGDLTLLTRREIPPGDYEAVAVVRDLGTGKIGALRIPVRVPSFPSDRMAMSTLILESRPAPGSRVGLEPEDVGNQELLVPDARRIFLRTATPVASCLVYHPRQSPDSGEARVRVKGSVRKGGETVRDYPSSVHVIAPEKRIAAIPLEIPLLVAELDPGIYTLRVEALDEVGGHGIVQSVDFMVR